MGETLKTNTAILIIALVMALSNAFLVYKVFQSHERVVLVPPTLDQKASVGWKTASLEYKKSFALFVAGLVGNITPSSVEFVVDALGRYFSPAIYSDLRTRLMAIAQDPFFKSSGAYSYYVPTRVEYEPATYKIFVMGYQVTGNSVVKNKRKNLVFEMTVSIKGGVPQIESLGMYEDSVPHTLEWHKRHDEKANKG